MDSKTLLELDYYKIRDHIATFCVSEEGKQNLLLREPFTNFNEYEYLKKISCEWNTIFSSNYNIKLTGWNEVLKLIDIIKTQGASLLREDVFSLGIFCNAEIDIVQKIFSAQEELHLKKLFSLAQKLPDLSGAQKEIFSVIDSNGELRDLPQIREIKKNIFSIKKEIDSVLKHLASSVNLQSALESNIPVLRNDRQVLAVKSSARSKVKGIIHEVSQSGQTVFIEPEEIVRRNNDLIQAEFLLEQEIRKIFTDLTARLFVYANEFEKAISIMITLDTTQAVTKWGHENNCCFAETTIITEPSNPSLQDATPTPDTSLILIKARHPLLKERAVPIDVNFIGNKKILILTGPNTGGKTVTLKTIALFAMLNQSGFPIPANEGSRLPCFDNVFADIGDAQSLDENLSTFSAHMKNIARALNGATQKSLVLLDELGSGTDPMEGAAIAMAVLDCLIQKGSFVLVTTHHGILKNYGWTHPSCINASVEFDQNTLRPTYKIAMGIPGESHALDIARRSNLPPQTVQKAASYIQTEQADISALIKGLNKKHSELDKMISDFAKKSEVLEMQSLKIKETELKLRRREHEVKVNENKNEMRFLSDTRKKLENLVRTLKEGEITREKTLQVKGFISDLTSSIESHTQNLEAEEKNLLQDEEVFKKNQENYKSNKPKKKRTKNAEALLYATPFLQDEKLSKKNDSIQKREKKIFEENALVKIISTKAEGTLIRKEKNDSWLVQVGAIKLTVPQKDLELLDTPIEHSTQQTASTSYNFIQDINQKDNHIQYDVFVGNKPVFELRLLGLRVDEALKLLERQLDLCVVHGFRDFSVIHGKGTGALQQAVQDYLSHYPKVLSFEFAPPEDGGSGKTYVKMRI